MNPQIVSTTGSGNSTRWVTVSPHVTPANISIGVTTVSGTANFTVYYTYDDVNLTVAPSSQATPTQWAISALTNKTSSTDTVLNQPVMAVQLVQNSGTGTATMYVLQAGIRQ